MSHLRNAGFNRKAYNLWAKQYDQDANSTIAVDDAHFPPLWAEIVGQSVLEIGCGTGRHTRRLVQAGNRVTAIDPSEEMLEIARSKVPPGSVEFLHADFLSETQLPASRFDAVIVSLVLEHIEDLPLFFQKTAEHMKPAGKLYISEIHPLRIAEGSQAHFNDEATGELVRLKSFAHSDAAITEAAAAAGLRPLETREVFGSMELSSLHPGWSKYLGKPMIKIWTYVNA